MATMTDDEVIRIWEKSDVKPYTEHTIVDLGSLFRELDTIRRCGYALDNEENELGVRCIGAAILDYTGRGAAALSISAPLARMTDARVEELSAEILATRTQFPPSLAINFKK